ncbi:MAG: hypothetical protein GY932_03725, partial [Arcobacter sp.]|nr:hypothetical protein [Arcobacter sp.]
NRVIDANFDDIGPYASKKFVPIYDKQKKIYEFINLDTKKYTGIQTYRNTALYGYNILDIGKGKKIILDANGKKIFKYSFDRIFPYTNKNDETYFGVSLKNTSSLLKAVLDKDSNIIVPAKYKDITPMYSKNGNIKYFNSKIDHYRHSLYNTNGDLILPAKYDEIKIFNEDKKYILAEINKYNSPHGHSSYNVLKEGSTNPLFTADYIYKRHNNSKYATFMKKGLTGIIDMNLKVVVEAKHKNITDVSDDFYATYLDGESIIYKIGNDNELLEVDGRVDFKDHYITIANRQEDSIYNYEFKKLNSKDLVSIEVCYKDKNAIVFQDEDEKWAVVYNENVKYLDGDFESVRCGVEKFIIAKLKNKSTR